MNFLLIDDHRLFAEGLQHVIEDMFHDARCTLAHSVADGLCAIESEAVFDLILIDLNMPHLDGVSFIKAAVNRQVPAPMAILSSSEDLRQIRDALDAGARGFIPKSMGKIELNDALRQILSGSTFYPQGLERRLSRLNRKRDARLQQYGLTPRQFEVLTLISHGLTNKQIATTLFVSEDTVKFHTSALFKALGVNSRTECILAARKSNLLDS